MPAQGSVLVVDDNADFLTVLVDALTMLGYAATGLSDTDAARAAVRQPEDIDLLILDLRLSGGVSGRELAELARQSAPDLPVVFLTGDPTAASDAGIDEIGPVIAKTDGILAIHEAVRSA